MDTQRITLYLNRYKNQLPWLVTAVLILITLITLLSDISYFRFDLPAAITAAQNLSHPVDLADQHIFGLFSDDFDDLPETQLQLTLQGTGVDKKSTTHSLAIISSPSQKARIFHIGDDVPGGAEIKDILFDRIVINNNGELQKLSMHVPVLNNQPTADNSIPPNSGLTTS
ncbi:MAG: type II secretion system protein N [Coxiellaceae bacterium]|nr:type II secretion system protein N [Coxiellaceae bacterium]